RLLDLENVAERHAEQFEGTGKIELGEAVLLRGLLGLLLVPVEGQIIGGQFAKIGFQRVDDVLGHIRDRNVCRLAGRGIPDLECALHRHFPDAAELEGETDRLDVERHPLMVAHPDEDRRKRTYEGDRPVTKNLVAVPRRRFPELARQISPIASALPTAKGLKVFESLTPDATMKLRQRTSSSRPKRRQSARTSP